MSISSLDSLSSHSAVESTVLSRELLQAKSRHRALAQQLADEKARKSVEMQSSMEMQQEVENLTEALHKSAQQEARLLQQNQMLLKDIGDLRASKEQQRLALEQQIAELKQLKQSQNRAQSDDGYFHQLAKLQMLEKELADVTGRFNELQESANQQSREIIKLKKEKAQLHKQLGRVMEKAKELGKLQLKVDATTTAQEMKVVEDMIEQRAMLLNASLQAKKVGSRKKATRAPLVKGTASVKKKLRGTGSVKKSKKKVRVKH